MKKLITLMIILALVACSSDRDKPEDKPKPIQPSRYGLDYIGGARYPDVVMANHPEGWASGFLLKVDGFGSSLGLINKMAESGKSPNMRVHLIWRDSHKFGQSEADLAVARCREMLPTVKQYSTVQWYISPWLEPITYSKDLYWETINKCRDIFQGANVRMTSNSIPTHEFPATYTEMHHKDYNQSPKLQIFSFDGEETNAGNIDKYLDRAKGAELFFLWSWRLNGKSSKQDSRKRPDRIHWADAGEIKRLMELVR